MILGAALMFTHLATKSVAQPMSEGKITFEISYPDSDIPDEQMAMMPTEMEMYIKDDKTRVEMTMGMGMSNVTIVDNKTKTATTLMDMMGNKMAIKSSEEEYKKQRAQRGVEDYKIEKTNETKTIAGYACKKAVVTGKDGTFDIYYAPDIVVKNSEWHSEYKGIDGFPMEYRINQGRMNMQMTAKKVAAQKVDDKLFTIPDGYKEMTQDEMKKMFGGR